MTEYQPKTTRDLLIDLGVGRFNATMIIQTMMMAPAVTEAASAQVMVLVQHIQMVLRELGAPVRPSGIVDEPTDLAMQYVAGTNWLHRTWFDVTRMLVAYKKSGKRLDVASSPAPEAKSMGLFDLPDVPGGIVTYGIGAYLLYRALKKKRS